MNKHILVVDDELEILDFVQPFLNEEGYDVRTTTSGSIVVQHVELDHIDLILLDIVLQGKDGRVISRQLKTNERTKHIPVILFSAQVTRDNALRESLADDFLGKPFDLCELLEVIQQHLP